MGKLSIAQIRSAGKKYYAVTGETYKNLLADLVTEYSAEELARYQRAEDFSEFMAEYRLITRDGIIKSIRQELEHLKEENRKMILLKEETGKAMITLKEEVKELRFINSELVAKQKPAEYPWADTMW